jgi:hypothetical protein
MDNGVGVQRIEGRYRDVALFAIEQPEVAAEGISAVGRTCFVRRGPPGIVGAALHGGNRLTVDGQVILASQLAGDLLANFGPAAIDVVSQQYDSHWIEVFSPQPPAKVIADGKPQPAVYDAARRLVRIEGYCPRRVQIMLP